MNDLFRKFLSRGFVSLILCFFLTYVYAEEQSLEIRDTLIEFNLPDLPPFVGVQIETETPLQRIRNETLQFLADLRSEFDKTMRGIGYMWYSNQVNLNKEINCLAQNIYYEARGESMAGQLAVALVTVNRVKSADYPPSVCQVVYQKTKNENGKWIAQFSWVQHHKSAEPRDQERWAQAIAIAERVLAGGRLDNVKDITHGSMFFHTTYVHPKKWNKYYEPTMRIGNHIFFRPKRNIEYRSDPVAIVQN